MYKRRFLAMLLFLGSGLVAEAGATAPPSDVAPSGTYVLDKTHASLLWRVNHMGMSTYTARFSRFDAVIHYDMADASHSSVEATIEIGSIDTGYPIGTGRDFNAELRSPPFLNAVEFPTAVFRSQRVQVAGPHRLRVIGLLTSLGTTRPMTLAVTVNGSRNTHPVLNRPWLGISARGKVQREAFGVNPMPQLTGIGGDVEVDINAEFVQQL